MHLVLMEMLAESLQSLGAAVPEPVIFATFPISGFRVYLVVSDCNLILPYVPNEVICPLIYGSASALTDARVKTHLFCAPRWGLCLSS
jgi:hypothetical protein